MYSWNAKYVLENFGNDVWFRVIFFGMQSNGYIYDQSAKLKND